MTFIIDTETPVPAPRARSNQCGLRAAMQSLAPGHSISPLSNSQRVYAYRLAKEMGIRIIMRQDTDAPTTYKLWRVE